MANTYLARSWVQKEIEQLQRENAEMRNRLEDFQLERAEADRLLEENKRLKILVADADEAGAIA